MPALLARVEQVRLWGLYGHPPLQTWSCGHVALLGDAVHPMFPFMAQGACMALEDAFVLARVLNDTDNIRLAFAGYETTRKQRATSVQQLAARNGKVFHLSNPAIRTATHESLRLSAKIAPHKLENRFDWIYKHKV